MGGGQHSDINVVPGINRCPAQSDLSFVQNQHNSSFIVEKSINFNTNYDFFS